MNGRTRSFIIGGVLFLPLLIYAFLKGCTTPVFNPLPKVADTIWSSDKKNIQSVNYHQIPDFQLTDQDGKPFTDENMKGSIWLVNFISPTQTLDTLSRKVQMGNTQKEFYENADNIDLIKVLTISTNPNDTPEQMKAFAKEWKLNTNKWVFTTGNEAEILKIMKAMHLPQVNDETKLNENFLSPNSYFIDAQGFVRGMYIGTQLGKTGFYTLKEDLRLLLYTEYKGKVKNNKAK